MASENIVDFVLDMQARGSDVHVAIQSIRSLLGLLEGMGGRACVERTRAIVQAYELADALRGDLLDRHLADVWQAVEAWRSGGPSQDPVSLVEAFDARYQHASGPGDLVDVAARVLDMVPPPYFDDDQVAAWTAAMDTMRAALRRALPEEHRPRLHDPEIPF